MTELKKYMTAGAFRRALEEHLKRTSQTDQTDINRLRRQVSFDRLLQVCGRVNLAAVVVGAVGMWEALFAFHISIAQGTPELSRGSICEVSCVAARSCIPDASCPRFGARR
jgi:hypothetical protein